MIGTEGLGEERVLSRDNLAHERRSEKQERVVKSGSCTLGWTGTGTGWCQLSVGLVWLCAPPESVIDWRVHVYRQNIAKKQQINRFVPAWQPRPRHRINSISRA